MDVKTFPLGPLETNCYLASIGNQAIAVDPGGDPASLVTYLRDNNLTLTHILNTHLHFDHTMGNAALHQTTHAPILANPEDAYLMDTELGTGGLWGLPKVDDFSFTPMEPGETTLLGTTCVALPTPGHTKGSLTFYFPEHHVAFVGDLIFYRSVGRTDFPGGNFETLQRSVIERIFSLPVNTILFSGHGDPTTVGDEKLHNPFFSDYQQ